MQNQLNERFKASLNHLKTNGYFPSVRQFSKTIEVHPQCISDISTGKRDVNLDILNKTIQSYDLNPDFLFFGEGPILKSEISPVEEVGGTPILAVVTEGSGKELIVHVPYAAQAGYIDQMHDQEYLGELPSFSLPDARFQYGTHRCFDVAGDSMEPVLFNGEQVICEFVEPDAWNNIKNNYVYVIATTSGIVVKRIENRITSDGTLVLSSDNSFYERIILDLTQVKEIWRVTYKLSPFLGSPSNLRNGLNQEMDSLRNTIAGQGEMIQSLNSTIEKLLRQSRKEVYSAR